MALLFGNTGGRSQSKNLLEFKAGKMQLKGNMVHPDKRKGLVFVHQSDDSLMHFCWKDRTTNTVEDDLIIFPDDVEYKRVAQCTTGRVYVLKFKSTNRKCFFWMQDPKQEKDDDNCAKVNEFLNNPPAPGSSRSGGSTPGALGADLAGEGDLQNLFSAMNQQQFMQLLGGMGGVGGMANLSSLLSTQGLDSRFLSSAQAGQASSATTAPTATTTTTSSATGATATPAAATPAATNTTGSGTGTATPAAAVAAAVATPVNTASATDATPGAPRPARQTSQTGLHGASPIQLSDLQSILSGISVPSREEAITPQQNVDLSTAMTSDILQPILTNPEFIQRLQEFLPRSEGDDQTAASADLLRSTVHSPQFQQAVSMFSAALQSGQLGPLMQQFGLGDNVATAAAQGDLDAFVGALQSSLSAKPASETETEMEVGKDKDKDDDDEDMALD